MKLSEKIRKFFKLTALFVASGSFSAVLAACYGMPADMDMEIEKQLTVKDPNSEPIKDLNVTVTYSEYNKEFYRTDSNGSVHFRYYHNTTDSPDKISIEISDSDGSENQGLFETTNFSTAAYYDETLEIQMKQED